MEGVVMTLGTNSVTMVSVTPTHISPITFEGMRLINAHGGFRKSAPAAKGAARIWGGEWLINKWSNNQGTNYNNNQPKTGQATNQLSNQLAKQSIDTYNLYFSLKRKHFSTGFTQKHGHKISWLCHCFKMIPWPWELRTVKTTKSFAPKIVL